MKWNRAFIGKLVLHLTIMGAVGLTLLLGFYYIGLPLITKHHQSVTVPNLYGLPIEDAKAVLKKHRLISTITEDLVYSSELPPSTVLIQQPKAGTKVKQQRRIYLSLNAENPPSINMPNLHNGSIRNAQLQLKMHGLLLGKVRYIHDNAKDVVLGQYYQGKKIAPGTNIVKGSKIDLLIAAGLGKQLVMVPKLIGKDINAAKQKIISAGLQIGSIIKISEDASEEEKEKESNETEEKPSSEESDKPSLIKKEFLPGAVIKQIPAPSKRIRRGEIVDLWILASPEAASSSTERVL